MHELTIRAVESAYGSDVRSGFSQLADSLAMASADDEREKALDLFKRRLVSAIAAHDAAVAVIDETIGTTE